MLGVVVLAAGEGKRTRTKRPKILHTLCEKPMVSYAIDHAKALSDHVIVVTSPALQDHAVFEGTRVCVQETAKGTGDAVKKALSFFSSDVTRVLILFGDTPLVKRSTLADLVQSEEKVLIFSCKSHETYGRCFIKNGKVERVIEFKDATEEEKTFTLANSGIVLFERSKLEERICNLKPSPITHEYYLTDCIYDIPYKIVDFDEMHGVNTLEELAHASEVLQNRQRSFWMSQGVWMIAPQTVYLAYDTVLGKDSIIHPFVTFGKKVVIDPQSEIFSYTHLENCHIHSHAKVGPFARIRGESVLNSFTEVGNFVEIKKSTLMPHAKAKHLSYIGDAVVGEKTNIGAGFITANYDGTHKHQTFIGKHCSIGANTVIIAPVCIKDNAKTAAGSVITDDIPDNAIAFARSRQVNKPIDS